MVDIQLTIYYSKESLYVQEQGIVDDCLEADVEREGELISYKVVLEARH